MGMNNATLIPWMGKFKKFVNRKAFWLWGLKSNGTETYAK